MSGHSNSGRRHEPLEAHGGDPRLADEWPSEDSGTRAVAAARRSGEELREAYRRAEEQLDSADASVDDD
jgi:hypothetical protein